MVIAFLASYFSEILLATWLILGAVVILHYYEISLFKRINGKVLLVLLPLIHLGLATLASVVQYIVWSRNEFTRNFVMIPLPDVVPLGMFEFLRPIFEGVHGYVILYCLGRFFLELFVLFCFTILIAGVALLWRKWKPGTFYKSDVIIVTLSSLLVGWPQIVLLVPSVLVTALLLEVARLLGLFEKQVRLSTLFLFSSVVLILFGKQILSYFNLYTLLAL